MKQKGIKVEFSSPHGDFSFSIKNMRTEETKHEVFVPSRGFLFFYQFDKYYDEVRKKVFVPSRGFLFFYEGLGMNSADAIVFVPSRGFLFFYPRCVWCIYVSIMFSSPHGDFSFSIERRQNGSNKKVSFSSPHGDFSFSIVALIPFVFASVLVFVPSRGFLFFYPISYSPYKSRAIFIICGANIFKPSECYF